MSTGLPCTLYKGVLSGTPEDCPPVSATVQPLETDIYRVAFDDGQALMLGIRHHEVLADGTVRLVAEVEGTRHEVLLTRGASAELVLDHGGIHRSIVPRSETRSTWRSAAGAGKNRHAAVSAPMPARIAEILVGESDVVEEGAPLIRIEAMKMVMTLSSPRRGRIEAIHVAVAANVSAGDRLISLADDVPV
jgi:acetyl/propionyl-CoA carboxylase alpha subunit